MASLPPSRCCAQGTLHKGEPKGTFEYIADVETYVVGSKSSDKLLLILTDVIGHRFINAQLIADAFAREGYLVVMPDILFADPIPLNRPEGFDFNAWLEKHNVECTEPIVKKVLEASKKAYNPKFVGTVGYCFGAKFVARLLGDELVDAGAMNHPSFITLDEVRAIKRPVLIIGAEKDEIYTTELRHKTEEVLAEIKATYHTTLAYGVVHGFAVRGNPEVFADALAKEKAFNDEIWWFSLFQK